MRSVGGRGTTHWYLFGIHEVYTDEDGKVSWTEDPVSVVGDTPNDLKSTLELMSKALKKPILDFDTGKPINASKKILATSKKGKKG